MAPNAFHFCLRAAERKRIVRERGKFVTAEGSEAAPIPFEAACGLFVA
jgi:hypothetical protein